VGERMKEGRGTEIYYRKPSKEENKVTKEEQKEDKWVWVHEELKRGFNLLIKVYFPILLFQNVFVCHHTS